VAEPRSQVATAEGSVASATRPTRALALDALRGLAILGMVMSGTIPEQGLPAWMYHAQDPPPLHRFSPHLAGLTWTDLVFPFFLFAMGAAIPLALSRRLARGVRLWRVVVHILTRGFLLGAFALYIAHIRPWTLSRDPTTGTWLLALLGFALLFPILTRLPDRWPLALRLAIRAAGWAGAILLMASLQFHGHHGVRRFSVERSDIIIVLLANAAVFGSLLWLISRGNLLLRLGFLGILAAIRLSASVPGWVGWLDAHSPLPWMFQLGYLQWLFITIPGTVVGDMLLRWGRATESDAAVTPAWSRLRIAGLAVLMPLIIVAMLAGLQSRWLWQTSVLAVLLCALGWRVVAGAATKTERLAKDLFACGTYCLLLGLVLEPYEGGIKKVPDTLSYYFVTGGLAIFALLAFTLIIEIWGQRRRLQLLIDSGENPMIAYAGSENLLLPVLALTHLDRPLDALAQWPWLGVLGAAFSTLVLAYVVRFFTRLKVFWRT
jgi:predicted acyltransferase